MVLRAKAARNGRRRRRRAAAVSTHYDFDDHATMARHSAPLHAITDDVLCHVGGLDVDARRRENHVDADPLRHKPIVHPATNLQTNHWLPLPVHWALLLAN